MNTQLDEKKVVLGLSGGVDSTASALLLQKKGFEVIGLHFNVHGEDKSGDIKAKKVAEELGIDLIIKNVTEDFTNCVIGNFICEYTQGRTPNPCIMCNPNIKFKVLIDTADEVGAKYVATGHYAKIKFSELQKCYVLTRPKNEKKDQTYMMYRLPEAYVSRLILPLNDIDDKELTRNIARDKHMSNAEDKDSQEICFIPDDISYMDFLKEHNITAPIGNFVDMEGNVLGKHQGIINYTIGQRKGLGMTFGKPMFVVAINGDTNEVVLGDNEDLFKNEIVIDNCYFQSTNSNKLPDFLTNKEILGKIRYAAKPALAKAMQKDNGDIVVTFAEKQRAATPGQSLVLYIGDELIGGGFIKYGRHFINYL